VDGGKGQLGVAMEVLAAFGLTEKVPVAALAKQREELFVRGQAKSILLPRRSQGLFLVQRIRDEAHRFGVAYNRTVRTKRTIASQLDSIPGVGPGRRDSLLKKFGSVKRVRAASVDQIADTPGIPRKLAESIKKTLS
ncbi:MAG: helix-hairpin-helix domain-containing protein, partial [Candidatus Zixiibacteriota bacterium]